ncbi:LIM domain only protein 3-like [Frankliniella occidentalis]|uniref:LIM domain only protein 3-like n=2 Tax=Frankliniella occidentalis TaxID=133901 RepID=A0A6J1RWZ2_FRAOC|nr:LIM domain only protein 3-like [Frankliniella occidentalis]
MEVKVEAQNNSGPQKCAGCGKIITERYMLKALDMLWHEDCLKCGCCDCRLGEVGSTLYTKANLLLCRRDYLRLFGSTGYCAACSKVIPAFEMVMRARHNVYHLECFACQQCSHRFCVGDRFYLCENKILCEYDYEERMVFANMSQQTSLPPLKRQANNNNNITVANNNTTNSNNNNSNQQQQQQQQTSVQCNVTVNEDNVSPPGQQPLHVHVQVSSGYHHQLLDPVGGRSK